MIRRNGWLALALLVSGVTIGCGWKSWENRWYRNAIADIKADMAAGRYAVAARGLAQLATRSRAPDEAAYLLGVCEQARGRNDQAIEAWTRVTPGSAFSSRAIEARMSLLISSGRLAAAEQLIDDAARDPRHDGTALRVLLLPTFTVQGRLAEVRRLVQDRWDHLRQTGEETSELAINLGRLHMEIRADQYPVEAVRAELEQAATKTPDDDRVWLGLANLAIRAGARDQAERRLDACLARRPDDDAVWRARLDWGMAAGRPDVVRQAAAHLPPDRSTPAQADRIDAWMAAKQGDAARERQALDRLVAAEPADLTAFARLTELSGQPDREAAIKKHEAEIKRLTARYQKLYERNQPIRDALEMGRLAASLGRPFEARVFLTIAAAEGFNRVDAQRELDRLSRHLPPDNETGKVLAELIPDRTREMAAQLSDKAKEEKMLNHENHEITRKNAK